MPWVRAPACWLFGHLGFVVEEQVPIRYPALCQWVIMFVINLQEHMKMLLLTSLHNKPLGGRVMFCICLTQSWPPLPLGHWLIKYSPCELHQHFQLSNADFLHWWLSVWLEYIHFCASMIKDADCFVFFFFLSDTLQVSLKSARPNKHTDNVCGFVTDGSCICAVSFASVSSIKTWSPVHNYSRLSMLDEALRQQNKLSDWSSRCSDIVYMTWNTRCLPLPSLINCCADHTTWYTKQKTIKEWIMCVTN